MEQKKVTVPIYSCLWYKSVAKQILLGIWSLHSHEMNCKWHFCWLKSSIFIINPSVPDAQVTIKNNFLIVFAPSFYVIYIIFDDLKSKNKRAVRVRFLFIPNSIQCFKFRHNCGFFSSTQSASPFTSSFTMYPKHNLNHSKNTRKIIKKYKNLLHSPNTCSISIKKMKIDKDLSVWLKLE